MEFTSEVMLLTAVSKPYAFNGNEGVSHRLRFSVKGEVYPIKTTEALVKEFAPHVQKTGKATFKLTSEKENIKLELVSFVPSK